MKTTEFQERIDKVTETYKNTFSQLSFEQLNWKQSQSEWSIAQNIQHVVKVNNSYFPIFKKIKSGRFSTPLIGVFTFLARSTGNSMLKSVMPKTARKTKTLKRWLPTEEKIDAHILYEFIQHQDKLKENIEGLDKWINRKLIIHSPLSQNVVLYLDTAIEILISHELRHYHQAERIKNAMLLS